MLKDEVMSMFTPVEHFGLCEFHTGVGAYGEIAVLPLDGAGSANEQALFRLWGEGPSARAV